MMLNVTGLRTGYGRIPILNGVSFGVKVGEFIGILGHNGMGKTTLLKALMGFLPATGGLVRFDGHDVTAAELVVGFVGVRRVADLRIDALDAHRHVVAHRVVDRSRTHSAR